MCRPPGASQIDLFEQRREQQSSTVERSPSSAQQTRPQVKARGRSIHPNRGLGDSCAASAAARGPRQHRSACALLLLLSACASAQFTVSRDRSGACAQGQRARIRALWRAAHAQSRRRRARPTRTKVRPSAAGACARREPKKGPRCVWRGAACRSARTAGSSPTPPHASGRELCYLTRA